VSLTSKGFLNYIHYLRGFAILVIVGIHCRTTFSWGDNLLEKQVFTTALDNGTIIFVFIAGFLFHYLKAKFEYKSYLIRKTKYVVIPYLLVSALPILLKMLNLHQSNWVPDEMVPDDALGKALFYLASGRHIGPFWFIPMIVIFYVISPLLLKLDNHRFYKILFPVLMVASLFTYKFGFYTNIWVSFLHFLPVYIFGMWAANYKDKIVSMPNILFWILVVTYLALSVMEIAGIFDPPRVGSFEDNEIMPLFAFNIVKLRVYLLCLILMRIFYYFNDKDFTLLWYLGDYSFGIYFIHIFVIKAFEWTVLAIYPDFVLNSFSFLIFIGLVSIGSILAVKVIKLIFKDKSRMIIGS